MAGAGTFTLGWIRGLLSGADEALASISLPALRRRTQLHVRCIRNLLAASKRYSLTRQPLVGAAVMFKFAEMEPRADCLPSG
jgi:hypothetical protein